MSNQGTGTDATMTWKWLTLMAAAAAAAVWLKREEEQDRWRWRELSLTARLRDSQTRAEVFERALARLRADAAAGKLVVNDDYRLLFDRLTAEARAEAQAAERA